MSATSMLKGAVCRIGDSSLDGRSLGELDCSDCHERQQYNDESVSTKCRVTGTSNESANTTPRVEESARNDCRNRLRRSWDPKGGTA